jgi:K+-transporting ATPase ATPase C chain
MTLLTGVVYPLVVTEIAKGLFPDKVSGSLLKSPKGDIIGSSLIGQKFTQPIYFQGRPSAGDYATVASGASNKGATSADLKKSVEDRIAYWKSTALLNNAGNESEKISIKIPDELLFASGSGLDPHLSPATVLFQVKGVAKARHFNDAQTEKLKKLIESMTEKPQFGILGQERINVLLLNIELDKNGASF